MATINYHVSNYDCISTKGKEDESIYCILTLIFSVCFASTQRPLQTILIRDLYYNSSYFFYFWDYQILLVLFGKRLGELNNTSLIR
jgi:hypothetical protein